MYEDKAYPDTAVWKKIHRLEENKKKNEIVIQTKGGFKAMDPRKIK